MNKNFMFCWPAASLYNLVNETNLVHSLVLVYLLILHVSGGYGPIIRRNNCVFATLYTCYSVWMTVWYAEAYAPAFIFINLYMFRAAMGSSSGETTVFLRHFALVILCGWLSGTQKHMLLHLYLLNCTCFGRLWVHHQEKQLCFCDTWCILYCVDDRLVIRTNSTLHTGQSSTQNNMYQVSQKHNCFSWWWAHSRSKHVEIDKYTKNKLCTKLVLFARLYRDTRST